MIEPNLEEVLSAAEETGRLSHFVSNKALKYIRLVQFILLFGYKFYRIIRVASFKYFCYFTTWVWMFDILYSLVALLQAYAFDTMSNMRFRQLTRLQLILFSIIQPLAWLATFIYWWWLSFEVFDQSLSLEFRITAVLTNTLHLVFPLIDLIVSKAIVTWPYAFFPMFVTFTYFYFLAGLYMYTGMEWPYPFLTRINEGAQPLDVNWGPFTALLGGTLFSVVIFFGLLKLFILLRDKLGSSKTGSKS